MPNILPSMPKEERNGDVWLPNEEKEQCVLIKLVMTFARPAEEYIAKRVVRWFRKDGQGICGAKEVL